MQMVWPNDYQRNLPKRSAEKTILHQMSFWQVKVDAAD